MRSDVFLVTHGDAVSRSKARELIDGGNVRIDGKNVKKASEEIDENAFHKVEILSAPKYVSRGGLKLEHALVTFGIDVSGKTALDIGASTGGFTDCLLQNGAALVFAVDSGEGQLSPSLRENEKVVCMEKYNARNMKPNDFPQAPDIAVMDVSFISQTLILPGIADVLGDGKMLISLIKPQFEAGRAAVGKNGIVKKASDRERAILRVLDCAEAVGLGCVAFTRSPIEGGDGNVEYLAAFVRGRKETLDRSCIGKMIESR